MKWSVLYKQVTHYMQQACCILLTGLLCLVTYPAHICASQLDSPCDASPEETERFSLAIAGDFGPIKESLINTINDIITNCGQSVTFPVLKGKYQRMDCDVMTSQLPKGAQCVKGNFHWIPTEDQTGTFPITFSIMNRRGHQEVATVTMDVLPTCKGGESCNSQANQIEEVPSMQANNTQHSTEDRSPKRGRASHRRSTQCRNKDKEDACEPADDDEDDRGDDEDDWDSDNKFLATAIWQTTTGRQNFYTDSTVKNSSTYTDGTDSAPMSGSTADSSNDTSGSSSSTSCRPACKPKCTPPPEVPVLHDPGVASFNGAFTIEWSDTDAFIYELQQAQDSAFATITNTFFPTDPLEVMDQTKQPTSGYYYYRVRAWSDLPENGGLSSDFSNVVVIGVTYERDIDILAFPSIGTFSEVGGDPGTTISSIIDPSALSNPVMRFDYDLTNQFFAGIYFQDAAGVDIASMNSINIRLRGDESKGFPIRMVIELKNAGAVQGVVFISDLDPSYEDLTLPFYTESTLIDEVIILVEDTNGENGDGAIFVDEFFFSEQPFTPDIVPAITQTSGSALTDEEVLDKVEAKTARYFYEHVIGPGHVKDSSETDFSSIAATGFGLATLAILAERYNSSCFWKCITPAKAEARAHAILDEFLRMQSAQSTNQAEFGVSGFFYHFVDADGTRHAESEVSVVDTALLIVGALVAGEYFGGDVKTKADQLYANIDWTFFLNETSLQYHMAWKPESARGFTTPKGGGFISNATFNRPTDEVLLISLLALGNHFDNDMVRKSYFGYPRASKTYTAQTGTNAGTEFEVVNSFFGSLFTYLYAHCYFDFESLGADNPALAPEAPFPISVDWWENSVQAFRANRQFCVDQRSNFPFAYTENSWGISAVQRPDGRYEGRYGAVPFENGPGQDGVVACYGALSSMPFFRESSLEQPSENEGFQALRYYYNNYYDQLFGPFGFFDSFDNKGNFSSVYLGLDQGPIVLMIENYRSKLIWNTLLQNEKLTTVLDTVFSDSFDFLDVSTEVIDDGGPASELEFGTSSPGVGVVSSLGFVKIDYNFATPNARLTIYTDNMNNPIPYSGTGNAGGLVGVLDSTQVAPMSWVVFDAEQPGGYTLTGNPATEALMQDKSDVDFMMTVQLEKRTIVDGMGNLAPYPSAGRTSIVSSVFLYFGADFTGLEPQEYRTDTITIEIVHE